MNKQNPFPTIIISAIAIVISLVAISMAKRNHVETVWTPLEKEAGMSNITINGRTYTGNNITVNNGKVFIDGKSADDGEQGRILEVRIQGEPVSVHSDTAVTVNGNVNGNVDAGSSVNCGNVQGSVKAGSSVNCGDIGGEAKAGSSINRR